jgi:hypothetical protein
MLPANLGSEHIKGTGQMESCMAKASFIGQMGAAIPEIIIMM